MFMEGWKEFWWGKVLPSARLELQLLEVDAVIAAVTAPPFFRPGVIVIMIFEVLRKLDAA